MTTTETAPGAAPAPAPRLDLQGAWPGGYRAMNAFDRAVAAGDVETALLDLVKQRVSQINGCAYCLDMHAKDLRAAGESQQRLDVLSAWREVPLFTGRERAALALAEAITLVADGHVPDDVVEVARREFTPPELAHLVYSVVVINAWNRIAITARMALPPA
ncbi:MAG TPA: carboxymuconolactone decarboxylase family protein [Acidimicrobiales bacterium]|nr:carboxymuconolactone decarboxylase family protein [Acidimicrobiales bacterium]